MTVTTNPQCTICHSEAVYFCAPLWYCVEHHPRNTGTTLLADMLPKGEPAKKPVNLHGMEERLVNLEREMGEANMGELVSALNSLSMRLAKIERIIMERTGD